MATTLQLILAVTFLAAAPERAGAGATEDQRHCRTPDKELRQAIAEVHEKQRNVGLAAVIYRAGSEVFAEYLGRADIEHDVPIRPETRFGIASITKLFTAATLLKLHSEGRIDLDAPVQQYVPTFPTKPEGEITVRMLVTHRSGIPHPEKRTPELFATHYATAAEALEVFADDALVASPGSKRIYSSSNYNLLAAIIEGVTGKPFPEVVQHELLDPLRLSSTSFDDVLRPLPHRARRYSFYQPWTYAESRELYRVPSWDYSFNMGGGNIISTAADVAKLGAALTRSGFLSAEALDLLYDESWFGRLDDHGRQFIYVTGANPGVQAGLAVYRDAQVASTILSNTWGRGSRSGEMVALAKELARLCLAE